MKRPIQVLGILLFLAIVSTWLRVRVPRTSGPIPQQAYVWQRDWTPAVKDAVAAVDPRLSPPVVLAGQVSWDGTTPSHFQVPVDYTVVAGNPFGLALRIGEIDPGKVDAKLIADIAQSVIAAAPTPPAELHIDFDCAESKLAGYRAWLVAIREATKPVPVRMTALPAWLDSDGFADLAADGPYILQVHSLQPPKSANRDWRLIDPAAAVRAVERAARFRQDFRVALPTYGCVAVFDRQGKFVRLYAENYPGIDPAKFDVKFLHSDPAEMAGLVRRWTADRPAMLTGVMWYRLPVSGDQLNWRPATLAAVSAGHTPVGKIILACRIDQGLTDLALTNAGDADVELPTTIMLTWTGAGPIASDVVGGYRKLDQTPTSVTLSRSSSASGDPAIRLAPGNRRAIGWLRFTQDTEVRANVTSP